MPPDDVAAPSPGGESVVSSKREASPDAGGAGDEASRKRKKTGPGNRGVAHLTPEQLQKKRENGRCFFSSGLAQDFGWTEG